MNHNIFKAVFQLTLIGIKWPYKAIKNNIGQKTTEIVVFFYKKITKLVFLWPICVNYASNCLKNSFFR